MGRPALAAIPFPHDGAVGREVGGAAGRGRGFGHIEAALAIHAEIGNAGEAALGRVVIEPVLPAALRAVGLQQAAGGREPLDLLRAGLIDEEVAGGVIDIEPARLVEAGDDVA